MRALLPLVLLACGMSAVAQRRPEPKPYYPYRIEDISRPEWVWSEAYDINENNEVVGEFSLADGTYWAFYWSRETGHRVICKTTDHWQLEGSTGAFSINDFGRVVGSAHNASSQFVGWKFTVTSGAWEVIGNEYDPSADLGQALAISSSGQIAGNKAYFWSPRTWSPDAGTQLLSRSVHPDDGGVKDMNRTGTIVGFQSTPNSSSNTVFRGNESTGYTTGGLINEAQGVLGWGINDFGDAVIVGADGHTKIWLANGQFQAVTTNAFDLSPQDINNQREVVGFGFDLPLQAPVLWTPTLGRRKLHNLAPPINGFLQEAYAINDAGHTVGRLHRTGDNRNAAYVAWRRGPLR